MDDFSALVRRIAEALERLAPPPPDLAPLRTANRFVWRPSAGGLSAVDHVGPPIRLLLEMEAQKEALLRNTERFAAGAAANNALLWGVRGAGKSALVKAVHQEVASARRDLYLIEITREALPHLPLLTEALRGAAGRFILFIDDLSFEGEEGAMKALKSALEGGVGGTGAHVIVYATSNRRQIVARDARENTPTDLLWADTAEERLSLADRFGLWLGFHAFDQDQYLAVVSAYAAHFLLPIDQGSLQRRALQWSLARAARSGRTAWQFVIALAAELGVEIRL